MNTHLLVSFFILLLLSSCITHDKNTRVTDTTANSNETKYAYITDILENGDSVFVNADYVQYLTGDSAIAAAAKEGQADTVQIAGKMRVGVPNDYYILNNNLNLKKLRIDKMCEFDLLLDLDRVDVKNIDNSLSSLKIIYKDTPFILTLNKEETIIRIEEVFIP